VSDTRDCLGEIAGNLRWTWNGECDPLFRDVDPGLWVEVNHNPSAFLARVPEASLEARASDPTYRQQLHRARESLRAYLASEKHWGGRHAPSLHPYPIAYFSAEFGLHESLPIYSGGLGVLAGDHLKSCSDLGLPIWGVSILYRQGYFTQRIDAGGTQEERYVDLDLSTVPLEPIRDERGERRVIQLPTPSGLFPIDLWRARVGRAHLLLLDGSRDPAAAHRDAFTLRLYGGDHHTRLLQELILGVGGYRALLSLDVRPGVLHLNEGHSAFSVLEAIAQTMEEEGLDFEVAAERVRARTVFTTHTPVAAGHDRFPPDLVEAFLAPLRERLHLSREQLLGLGRVHPSDAAEPFCMTVLALKLSSRANAVSALHGRTSRGMWHALWPAGPVSQVPIGHVTNGVHVPSWIAPDMAHFFHHHLGAEWLERVRQPDLWEKIHQVRPIDLWYVKTLLKRGLLEFVERRRRVRQARLDAATDLPSLDPEALTIGVARRFVEYKRAALLFSDGERLERLLTQSGRPVQILFAGKAHPQDEPAKAVLRRIVERAQEPRFRGRVIVLEDHDMNLARHLVQGCDLWLNAPRRPLEACGTSGMKAVFNATLNLAILDGWWAEGYDGANGYAFGEGLTHTDVALQDRRDAAHLYDVLENQVLPDFFDRSADGVPLRWIARIQRALASLAWRYNSDRMVIDYATRCYVPAAGARTASFPIGF
jgi:glycogen phosphorylase